MNENGNTEEIKVFFANAGQVDTNEPDLHWGDTLEVSTEKPSSNRSKWLSNVLTTGFAFNLGKSSISAITTRVGAYTGNYMAQNQLNNGMAILGIFSSIGISVATSNPIPAIAEAVSLTMKFADYNAEVTKSNIQANTLSNLTSTSATDRSRGRGGKI